MCWSMVPVVALFLLVFLREGLSQDDFSGKGIAENDITLLEGRGSRTAVGGFEATTPRNEIQQQLPGQIMCYTCEGTAENSTCSDPVDPDKDNIATKVCNRGICLKWTKYRGGILQMIRTCSADIEFHLTMIDGVCRTERNGNGFLCMCGKHLCNSAPGQHGTRLRQAVKLVSLFLLCSKLVSAVLRPT